MSLRRLLLPAAEQRLLCRQATASFPEECCGILVGRPGGDGETIVSRLVPVANVSDDRERRFDIDPRDVLRTHGQTRATGETIVGFYHSHPVGGRRPSRRDREHAWPGSSYLIVTPDGGLSSWRCCAAGSLEPETVVAVAASEQTT